MRALSLTLVAGLLVTAIPAVVLAQMTVSTPTELKKFNVTIRRFDPTKGTTSGQEFTLPVDSPDEEHAIASTLANAASFSKKAEDGRPLPVAFMAVRVSPR